MRTFCIYKEFCFKNDAIVNEFVKKKNCVEQLDKGMSEKKIISPLGKIRKGKEKCPHSVGNIPKSENICKYKHFVGLTRFKILSLNEEI